MYEIRLHNPFTFENKVFKGETISKANEELSHYMKQNYVDDGTRVKLFEVEEIPLYNECSYCKELNEEKYPMEITELKIQGGYYNWHCEIRHCPYCGEPLKKYDTNKNK